MALLMSKKQMAELISAKREVVMALPGDVGATPKVGSKRSSDNLGRSDTPRPPAGLPKMRKGSYGGLKLSIPNGDSWYKDLGEFHEAGEGSKDSLWNVGVNRTDTIYDFMCRDDDSRLKAAGDLGLCRAIGAYGLRLSAMSLWLSDSIESQDRDMQAARSVKEKLAQKSKEVEEYSKQVLSLDETLAKTVRHRDDVLLAKSLLEEELQTTKEKLAIKEAEVKDYQLESACTYKDAFDDAIAQVLALHPGLELSGVDFTKVVRDGAIVSEDEEDGVEDHGTQCPAT